MAKIQTATRSQIRENGDTVLGPMHMSANSRYEIQRTNNFEVIIDDLPKEFTLSIDSCPLPNVSNEPIELAYGNSAVKVAGQGTYEDIEITCKDLIDADIEDILWEWRLKVYNPDTDKIGWAHDYKKDGTIFQYGPDGTFVRSWTIIGVWPTSMTPGDMAYDGSDKKTISLSLSVDKAYRNRGATNPHTTHNTY